MRGSFHEKAAAEGLQDELGEAGEQLLGAGEVCGRHTSGQAANEGQDEQGGGIAPPALSEREYAHAKEHNAQQEENGGGHDTLPSPEQVREHVVEEVLAQRQAALFDRL